jgi:hypothetical protein
MNLPISIFLILFCLCSFTTGYTQIFNVKNHGAIGDGKIINTAAIQKPLKFVTKVMAGRFTCLAVCLLQELLIKKGYKPVS